MSNPTEANPSLGPLLPLYNTSTGQTNIAWDVDPSTVATDAEGVTHGKAQISGSFSSTPPASVVSTVNSTTTPLTANATFTGTSESALAYGSISVEAFADQASASNGLIVEQSQDGTNWDTQASYTVAASTAFQQTINLTGQSFRVLYTNGTGNQGTFRLQVIKMPYPASSATTNQRVNAHSGDFVAGSIADLATLLTEFSELLTDTDNLATLVTNTADLLADGDHLATIDTSTAASKTDLDTIVTNTNKIPASPAQEGGNLATLVANTADLLADGDHLATIDTSTSNSATVEGATTDTAVVGDNTGTISAKLRGLTKILNDVWDSVNHLFHMDLKQVGGNAIAPGSNAVPILNSASTGYVSAWGSNPAALTSNTDAAFKWGASGTTQVNHIMVQNNSSNSIQWDLDVATNAGSPVLGNVAPGNTLFLDVQTTAFHLQSLGTPNLNGSSSNNVVIRGWL